MNTKHTPGPWVQAEYSKLDIVANGDTFIATARDGLNGIARERAIANARLIAAAPELLAALESLVAEYEPNIKTFATDAPRKAKWQSALVAIAKATGEQA
jgi:hypothetical protein